MKLYEAGQINIDLHWLNFLDQASTDNYSNRTAGGMIYIAEHDSNPQHLLTFISAIYDESFQPHEGASYKPVSNDQLEEQAVKAGVSSDVASQAFDKGIDYQSWLTAATAYTANRTDLHDGNGKFATPTVTINGTFWDATALMSQNQDMNGMLLKAIGLNPNKLGVDGIKPSLGEKKTPLN